MRLGIIARSDNTGLGNQTLELVKMLNPSKVMLIDSTPFNGNKQYPERYSKFNTTISNGFLTDEDVELFLDGLDIVLSCEIFYSDTLVNIARSKNVKTVLQYNHELFENIRNPKMPLPDVLLSPSSWNIEVVSGLFGGSCKVMHLPPPTSSEIFSSVRQNNMSKDHSRILHVAGRVAAKDRNGTHTLIDMLKYSKSDYELVIKVQHNLGFTFRDSRVTIDVGNPENREDLYDGFDGMVLPRRYGGLCLPMNEALLSGMPVFMTDISPNNNVLPKEWLAKSLNFGSFMTKTKTTLYEAVPQLLAQTIDNYINTKDKLAIKEQAFSIGNTFSVEELKPRYLELFNNML